MTITYLEYFHQFACFNETGHDLNVAISIYLFDYYRNINIIDIMIQNRDKQKYRLYLLTTVVAVATTTSVAKICIIGIPSNYNNSFFDNFCKYYQY